MNNYIIIGCARSGTTVTHLVLKGHPNVCALNDEIKIPPFFSDPLSLITFGNYTKEEKDLFLPLFFDFVTSLNPENKTIKAKGIKVAVSSPEDAVLFVEKVQKYLPGVHIFYINRKNYVAQYASLLRAIRTKQFHSWRLPKKTIKQIRFNKLRYYPYLLDCLEIKDIIYRLKKTHKFCELSYEEDIQEKNYSKVFNFLDIKDMPVSWLDSKKVAPEPETFIRNYLALEQSTRRIVLKYKNRENLNSIKRLRIYYGVVRKLKQKFSVIFHR